MMPNGVEVEQETIILKDPAMLSAQIARSSVTNRVETGSALSAYLELSKPRILVLILLIAIAGFCLASQGSIDRMLLLHMSVGISLLAAGVAALNQLLERDVDGAMRRTERRPLPAGKISYQKALLFGSLTSIVSLVYLSITVNALTGALGLFTLITYVFMYTPLKRRTTLSTVVGAFPGAIPPLMGWAALRGEIGLEAVVLFAIMFLWQFPHFLAIAWMYKEDYARAGICMLPVVEEGAATGRQVLIYALALLPVSLLPTLIGLAGPVYFLGAFILSLAYLYVSYRSAQLRTRLQAKRLLQISVIYLPLLFLLMLIDKN